MKTYHILPMALFCTTAAFSQTTLVKDDFAAGLHQDWTRVNDAYFQAPVQYLSTNGALRVLVPSASVEFYAAGGYSYFSFFRTNLIYEDFVTAVDLTDVPAASSGGFGLQARLQDVGFANGNIHVPGVGNGYSLLTYPVPDNLALQVLELNRSDAMRPAADFTLRTVFPRVPGQKLKLIFTGRGDLLTGQVFDLENLATPLATVQGRDAKYRSGFVGITGLSVFGFVHAFNEPLDLTLDNFAAGHPAPLYEFAENFDDASDSNTGLYRFDLFGSLGFQPAQFTFEQGAMTITAPASPALGGGNAGETLYTPFLVDSVSSIDLSKWNDAADARPVFYLTLRGHQTDQGYNFYSFNLSPTSFPEAANGYIVEPNLAIVKVTNNIPQNPSLALVRLTNITLHPARTYRLQFSAQGDLLTGWLYDLADLSKPLAQISVRDQTYNAAGYTGFNITDKGTTGNPPLINPVQVTVDNYTVQGVTPAPSLEIEHAVVLSWPASSAGYHVEAAPAVNGPWSIIGTVPEIPEGEHTLTMKLNTPLRFFRLQKSLVN